MRRLFSKHAAPLFGLKDFSGVDGSGRRLGQWIWPPRCIVCGRGSNTARDCCSGCRSDMPLAAGRCLRCGLELPRTIDACGECVARPPPYAATRAGYAYRAPVASLVQRFKFDGDLAAGRVLARLLAERLTESNAPRPDAMVPVPLNWRRQWRRGFNQSELLCRDLSRHFGGLPWADLLNRARPTVTQSELPAERRAGNVRGAFTAVQLPPGLRHAVLVDDVMTTGSTLRECARMLRRAGVGRVDVWVVARA
ncbi:MAG: ComF family protein [Wenzhouxiangellaceae bacterium]|nr:ComF family protein [Wenzhouxiangellaceae bacterium]MBS3822517.1 ComF family protein [Wenzhouxiangellaceae bacterium]